MNLFEEMTENCKAWEAAKNAGNKTEYPYSSGEMKAFWVFRKRTENLNGEFEMDDFCWESECHDFIETLRRLGIAEFTVTATSTALMGNIHGYAAEGCTMQGLHTITKKEKRWGSDEHETVQGILFKTN